MIGRASLQQALLPDIFVEAYPDQPKAGETPISLWGVTLDPANPQSDARVSVILMKFLRARLGLFSIFLHLPEASLDTWASVTPEPCWSTPCVGEKSSMSKRPWPKIIPRTFLES